MLNVITIRPIVSKMTSHGAGTVQMREESGSWIRKWEEMWFKMTAEDGELGTALQWRAMEDCSTDERMQQEMLCRRRWTDGYATDGYVERPEMLLRQNVVVSSSSTLMKYDKRTPASASAGRRTCSSSRMYVSTSVLTLYCMPKQRPCRRSAQSLLFMLLCSQERGFVLNRRMRLE